MFNPKMVELDMHLTYCNSYHNDGEYDYLHNENLVITTKTFFFMNSLSPLGRNEINASESSWINL
jgi:hypothetical protein